MADPEQPVAPARTPTPPASRRVALLVIVGRIGPDDAPELCDRVRQAIAGGDAHDVVCDVAGLEDADAGTLDALARLTLAARRLGRRVRLRSASPELRELLALAGLADVLPCGEESGLQAER